MKKVIATLLSVVLLAAMLIVPVSALSWKDNQTQDEDGLYIFDNAYGFVFKVNSVNGVISGEDATIVTSTEKYNVCNAKWSISVVLDKVEENVYSVNRVIEYYGAFGEDTDDVSLTDGQIVLVVHSAGSLPEDENGTYPNWQSKVAALALKVGDKITLANIDLAAGIVDNGTATVESKDDDASDNSSTEESEIPEDVADGLEFTLSDDGTYYIVTDCDESVTEVVIPAEYNGLPVKEIGGYAFGDCETLTSITIPDSVTSIGWSAFSDCSSLTSITIPNSVTSIGNYAFDSCSSLTSITIPDSVTSIGWGAFTSCSSLTSINIPDSVTSIGDDAFYGCSSLTSITIPDSVTSIGEWAFRSCSSLTSITIPDSVTSIGWSAFSSCSSLTSITIPDSVTSIGEWAFEDCDSLTDIYCEVESQPDGWEEDWNYNCDATVHWDYDKVLGEEFAETITETESALIESDYAEAEWEKIQIALNNAKEFSADGKSVAEIRSEIDALENAILLNPKKAEFGDLNGDEKVTSLDYLLVKRACFGTYELSNVELARADINRDKQTNSADYLLVKRIAFGTYKVQ
ncbi:MAG: leucine-rich repeat protein [Clostridia bacterium]|nr:leucine-rich repeat protein [Clostridia bacterium]